MKINNLDLDKDGWNTYIENNKDRIGVLLSLRVAYEDLLYCKNLDRNERNFMEAYVEFLESL